MQQPSLFENPEATEPTAQNRGSAPDGDNPASDGQERAKRVYSAYVCDNRFLFPRVLHLHVPTGAKIADVTYGQGVFWKNVKDEKYDVLKSDIDDRPEPQVKGNIDCRDLPYDDGSVGAVVLDPPYKEGFYRENPDHKPDTGSHEPFSQAYSNGNEASTKYRGSSKWQQVVVDMYLDAGAEARRVLKDRGILIVKCQDAVSANRNWMVHVDIINAYEELGFYAKDLFVMVRPNKPGSVNTQSQVHARKRHSYFLVFVKSPAGKKPRDMRSRSVR